MMIVGVTFANEQLAQMAQVIKKLTKNFGKKDMQIMLLIRKLEEGMIES